VRREQRGPANNMKTETLAIHAGGAVDRASGAVAEPITLSVAFERDTDGGHSRGYHYSAKGNPNRDALETVFAALEGGDRAVAFASGCAAIAAVLRTLRPGDHVLVPTDVFQGTTRVLREILPKWGITYSIVDMTDAGSVERAFQPNTRMVWMETLSNPLLRVTDVRMVAALARERGATSVVDNTFVTPIFQRPLASGVDLVLHATTKYAAGHGDVLGGMVVARGPSRAIEEIRQIQLLEGSVPAPFDCWLVRRGLKTLAYRMRGHAENAMRVAHFLQSHALIEAVHYPGLASHPQHHLAALQLSGGFGGIVSLQVRGGRDLAIAVCGHVRGFIHATSFGETESLIQHQASSPTHGTGTGLADNLLRLSVGLEHPDDLIEDLDQALRAAHADHPTQP
jgi:cystathionine gamma-synthase